MTCVRPLITALLLLTPALAVAQADEEMSSQAPDDNSSDAQPTSPKKHKKHKTKTTTAEEELAEEPDPTKQKLARIDDPRIGLGVELTLSLALLDKSYGPGSQGGAAGGIRVNWAPGFLWTDPEDEFWRYALLVELSYDYTGYSAGTSAVNTSTKLNYLNAHVMFGYPAQKLLLLYAALGPGMTFESVNYNVVGTSTPLSAAKFNLAYGIGARLNLQINEHVAFVSRMELLRFRRGDDNDTFLTLSVGGAF